MLFSAARYQLADNLPRVLDVCGPGVVLYGYVGLRIGFGVTALLLILFTRGRLGYQGYRPENAN
jgi:hypothetical protein